MSKQSNQSKIKIIPLQDKVLVKPLSPKEMDKKSASGIIIPDTVSKEKPEQGKVVAVGGGKYEDGKLLPMSVKVGDKIVFSKYGYDEVKINEEEYYILSESSILAIIK
ncbi:MAG TPA: co-chaperone GroES [Candidatus Paceibacterota bacterium]